MFKNDVALVEFFVNSEENKVRDAWDRIKEELNKQATDTGTQQETIANLKKYYFVWEWMREYTDEDVAISDEDLYVKFTDIKNLLDNSTNSDLTQLLKDCLQFIGALPESNRGVDLLLRIAEQLQ